MNPSVSRIAPQPHPVPEILGVTPAMAEAWLRTMVANRPISQKNVIEFAEAMYEGRWSLNGETIKFDGEGRLFDGQNRLQACLLADVSFRTYVIRGIDDPNAFSTVDTGKTRTASDIFAIAGWQNNKIASGAALIIYAYEHKRLSWGGITGKHGKGSSNISGKVKRGTTLTTVSRDELHNFATSIQQPLEQAVRFANASRAMRVMPSASVAALFYLFRQKSALQAELFFTDLGEGTGLMKGDPVYVLREKLSYASKSKAKLTRFAILGLTIKAWNKRRDQDHTKVLGVQQGEAFPRIK